MLVTRPSRDYLCDLKQLGQGHLYQNQYDTLSRGMQTQIMVIVGQLCGQLSRGNANKHKPTDWRTAELTMINM